MSISTILKTKTVQADFRVCCNHKNNRTACIKTMDALKNNFNNIVKIQAIGSYDGSEDMCVTGTATIRPSMKVEFERDLKKKINKMSSSIKITKSIVLLPKQSFV